jgi:hypothetical protein
MKTKNGVVFKEEIIKNWPFFTPFNYSGIKWSAEVFILIYRFRKPVNKYFLKFRFLFEKMQ